MHTYPGIGIISIDRYHRINYHMHVCVEVNSALHDYKYAGFTDSKSLQDTHALHGCSETLSFVCTPIGMN